MIKIDVPTINGTNKEVVYDVNDFPYKKFTRAKMVRKKKLECYNIACAFDIETTTIETEDENGKPYGFMYQWQFCIHDTVCFGRNWEEFNYFFSNIRKAMRLNNNRRLVVYVHNLAYEWQFMKDFIQIDSVFAKDARKPMKVVSDGIEFRCSYFLSNMSLIKFCENTKGVTHYKLADEYDYKKIRTPITKLTNEEMAYCYNDVRGLCECIEGLLEEDTIISIPLTSTGYVRRDYREAMKQNKNNHRNFIETKLNSELYTMFKKAFRGGNTHANRFLSNLILDDVYSFDISSSYPTSINIDYFPIGKFTEVTIDNDDKLNWYSENYCCLFEVDFYQLEVKDNVVIPYIDMAHCEKRGGNLINDNGRVLKVDFARITLTNIDLDIIRNTYNMDGFCINKSFVAKKGKLPDELRKKMMEYYNAKTTLKGVDGKEYEYMKSKNRVNATFGMMVTAIDHAEMLYHEDTMQWEEIEPNLEEALTDFYDSRNSFLSYQWGVFVTANARLRLQRMIDLVGVDVVYVDTDSVKFIGKENVKKFEKVNTELEKQALNNDIPAYAEKDGKKYFLGTWDNDGAYVRFKTLGAKKYCYETLNKDGSIKFGVTVSGLGKKKGAREMGCIENFNIGWTGYDIGRTTSTYNDVEPHKITIKGCTFTTASNIGIVDTTYTLGVTGEYWELIQNNGELFSLNY